jgi:hypothetical protein
VLIPDEVDLLIARLAGPLAPHARQAFRHAAEEALTRVSGELSCRSTISKQRHNRTASGHEAELC